MRFTVPAGTVLKVLLAVVAVLTGLSFILAVIDRGLVASPFPGFERALRLFDVNKEANLPAWFSSSVLLICALVLWSTARVKSAVGDRFARHWWVLAAAFLYLSLDELISLHEATSSIIRSRLGVGEEGALSQAWVLLAAPLVLLFALVYLRFLIHLPARVMFLTVAAGCTYVAGALGMELPGAYVRGTRRLRKLHVRGDDHHRGGAGDAWCGRLPVRDGGVCRALSRPGSWLGDECPGTPAQAPPSNAADVALLTPGSRPGSWPGPDPGSGPDSATLHASAAFEMRKESDTSSPATTM